MSKIRKSIPPVGKSSISQAKQSAEKRAIELINFSFKYLDSDHKKFSYVLNGVEYFCEVLRRVKDMSAWTKQELLSNRSSSLRAHPIEWDSTSEKNGFGFPKHMEIVDTPYQFAVSSNEHGRVHGFFINNTFYIVWLDRDHKLYPI